MDLVTGATVQGLKKIFPESEIRQGVNYWKNASSSYYYPENELNVTMGKIAKKAIKNPKFLLNFFQKGFVLSKELRKFIEKKDLSRLDKKRDKELLKIADEASKKFFNFYSYGTVASLLGYTTENPIYSKMDTIVKIKGRGHKKIQQYVEALTNPPKRLKIHELELETLEIAEKVKRIGLKTKAQISKKFQDELDKLVEKFAWMSFDFCDSIFWDRDHFAKLVVEKINSGIRKRISFLIDYEKNTTKHFISASKKMKLNNEEVKIFKLIGSLGYYKWLREYEFQKAFFLFKQVQDEFGRRIGLTTLESKFLLPDEYKKALTNKKFYKKLIKNRMKELLIVNKRNARVILEGKKAKKEFSKIEKGAEFKFDGAEIRGNPASSGYAKGKVKIINSSKEMRKMNKGDILVSQATTPEIISAMKKAAAIITNEGGITSHAAIISRELKIPCVIGTKIAAQVLKDGEVVEVDANKGIIKKLE